MKQWISGALAGLLICTAAGVPALAAEPAAPALAGTADVITETPRPDEPGTVSWQNLRSRIESGSLSAQALNEHINTIEAIDYQVLMDDLRDTLNELASAKWQLMTASIPLDLGFGEPISIPYRDSYTESTLDDAYDTAREAFDSIKDGEMQQDNADRVRQLEDAKNQIKAGAESLYIAILSMEQSAGDGARGLEALDRSLKELRLRQELGQVSALTVQEAEQSRVSLVSQLDALDAALTTYKIQLPTRLGEDPDGQLTVLPLPELDEETLDAIDPVADLALAKEASLSLYTAKQTLDDAEEEYKDNRNKGARYEKEMTEHTWNAAQLTYQSTVQDFETSFNSLYRAIQDQRQAVAEKESAVTYQARVLEVRQSQYSRGRIAQSALLAAQDSLASAQSDLEGAQRDLFSAWLAYQRAVEYGLILSSN